MTSSSPQRVVVRPPNWLGDAVLALPAMAAIRAHFPDAHLAVAAVPSVAALFREETDVRPNSVLELPTSSRRVVASLHAERFDLGLLFPNSFRTAWQLRRAGVPERWGFARSGRGWLLTRRSIPSGPRGPHQADYYRALVAGLGISCEADTLPVVSPCASSVAHAEGLLGDTVKARARLVGVAPGAAYGHAKQWPPARMAEVVARLVREAEATCVLVGAAHDRDAAREIESWLRAHAPDVGKRVVNLTGRTSLGALVAVIARLAAFVTNDSGAMHVAAALGRPVVALFGPTNEHATRPLGNHAVITAPAFCRPCHLRECPIDHRCMTRISVDEVTRAVVDALNRAEVRA